MSDKDLTLIRKNIATLIKGKTSPPDVQVAFLKKIMLDQKEYDLFLKDPEKYCGSQKPPIVLDPKIVEVVSRTVMFDAVLKADVTKLGDKVVKDMDAIRSKLVLRGPGTVAWPAAVAAIAAVVAAAAAVVSAVTSVTKDRVTLDKNLSNSKLRLDVLNKMKTMRPY